MIFPMTDHERRVRCMMEGFGQTTPERPTLATQATRESRVALLLEEVLEFAEDAAVTVCVRHGDDWVYLHPQRARISDAVVPDGAWALMETEGAVPNLAGMIDALGDISVVNTGSFVAFGVRMTPILECIDANNMLKIATGRLNTETGKFEKHPNHPKPAIAYELQMQAYDPSPIVTD